MSGSGTVLEDVPHFKIPAVSIRIYTERTEAMDAGVYTLGTIVSEQMIQAIDSAVEMCAKSDESIEVSSYVNRNVSA